MRPLKPPSGRDLMTIQSMTYGKMSKILDQAVFGEMGNFLPILGEAVGRCLPYLPIPTATPCKQWKTPISRFRKSKPSRFWQQREILFLVLPLTGLGTRAA